MAAIAAARSVLRATSLRSGAQRIASAGSKSPASRLRPSRNISSRIQIRSPVEMCSFCMESLMPMHSVTASALMTSMLSVSRFGYGWFLEGRDETR